MKNIKNYNAKKYENGTYEKIEEGIYKIIDNGEVLYVTSLTFVQEPALDEGKNAADISQYPLEDILDRFLVHISDFYDDINLETEEICYQEFASPDINDIKNLRTIIGKHVYNQEKEGKIILVIE